MTDRPVPSAVETLAAWLRKRQHDSSCPRSEYREAPCDEITCGLDVARAALVSLAQIAEAVAFERSENDALLKEVVALREWKAAHEAAAFSLAPRVPREPSEAGVTVVARDFIANYGDQCTPWDSPYTTDGEREESKVEARRLLRAYLAAELAAPLEIPFDAAKHHASCKPSDVDLVWHCNQCGLDTL